MELILKLRMIMALTMAGITVIAAFVVSDSIMRLMLVLLSAVCIISSDVIQIRDKIEKEIKKE